MHRLLATVVFMLLVLTGGTIVELGCASANDSNQLEEALISKTETFLVGEFNVYQPRTLATAECPEIELRWRNKGTRSEFFPGQGGFCTHLDKAPNSPVQARCVTRDASGQVVKAGKWAKAREADSVQQFLGLCPDSS